MSTEQPGNPAPAMDGKTIAIISYLTLIGWIIAFVMYGNSKSRLAIYHLRQTLLLMLVAVAVYIAQAVLLSIPHIGWLLSMASLAINIGFLILWVIGLIGAVNGQEKPMPVIGEKAQQLFGKMG